jgi:hypothetical protein
MVSLDVILFQPPIALGENFWFTISFPLKCQGCGFYFDRGSIRAGSGFLAMKGMERWRDKSICSRTCDYLKSKARDRVQEPTK